VFALSMRPLCYGLHDHLCSYKKIPKETLYFVRWPTLLSRL
jgi:hypothetical protein